jgi:hypothetical protein
VLVTVISAACVRWPDRRTSAKPAPARTARRRADGANACRDGDVVSRGIIVRGSKRVMRGLLSAPIILRRNLRPKAPESGPFMRIIGNPYLKVKMKYFAGQGHVKVADGASIRRQKDGGYSARTVFGLIRTVRPE